MKEVIASMRNSRRDTPATSAASPPALDVFSNLEAVVTAAFYAAGKGDIQFDDAEYVIKAAIGIAKMDNADEWERQRRSG